MIRKLMKVLLIFIQRYIQRKENYIKLWIDLGKRNLWMIIMHLLSGRKNIIFLYLKNHNINNGIPINLSLKIKMISLRWEKPRKILSNWVKNKKVHFCLSRAKKECCQLRKRIKKNANNSHSIQVQLIKSKGEPLNNKAPLMSNLCTKLLRQTKSKKEIQLLISTVRKEIWVNSSTKMLKYLTGCPYLDSNKFVQILISTTTKSSSKYLKYSHILSSLVKNNKKNSLPKLQNLSNISRSSRNQISASKNTPTAFWLWLATSQ